MVANRLLNLNAAQSVHEPDRWAYDEDQETENCAPALAQMKTIAKPDVTRGRARLISMLRNAPDPEADADAHAPITPKPRNIIRPVPQPPEEDFAALIEADLNSDSFEFYAIETKPTFAPKKPALAQSVAKSAQGAVELANGGLIVKASNAYWVVE